SASIIGRRGSRLPPKSLNLSSTSSGISKQISFERHVSVLSDDCQPTAFTIKTSLNLKP
ncbi:hypothetical protein M378DRAFT_164849, partial [Amanita muscaria Koide BX008]